MFLGAAAVTTDPGTTLRVLRHAHRLTQRVVSARAGIDKQRLSLIENGLRAKPDELARLARVLGVSPDTLAGPARVSVEDGRS